MRIASIAPPQPPLLLRNVHLTSRVATADPSVTLLTTLFVDYTPSSTERYGGHRSTGQWHGDRQVGMHLRAFTADADERRAAQAVVDAITASGLLMAELPPLDWKNPEVGRTRLYLDRRSRFLEFDTATPPAAVQPVLDALAAYELVARRAAPVAA